MTFYKAQIIQTVCIEADDWQEAQKRLAIKYPPLWPDDFERDHRGEMIVEEIEAREAELLLASPAMIVEEIEAREAELLLASPARADFKHLPHAEHVLSCAVCTDEVLQKAKAALDHRE
jgi:hypothetical protein